MFDRRTFLKLLAGLGLTGVGSSAYAAYQLPSSAPRVTPYQLVPRGWTPGLKLRIAALSDLHCGGVHMPMSRISTIVETANALKPDLILLLGDYVTRADRNVYGLTPRDWAPLLARLSAPLGVFAIPGNHEYWDDPEFQRPRAGIPAGSRALIENGIPMLLNKAQPLSKDGQRFWLAGLDDQIAFRMGRNRQLGLDDLDGTLAQVTDDAPVILMAHEPDLFVDVPERVSLTLSGHTHGGQIRLFGWSPYVPSNYGNRFAYGHVREDGRDLIVSCGLGTSGPPFRFGAPPEIVWLELG